jgi:hypothetical protein
MNSRSYNCRLSTAALVLIFTAWWVLPVLTQAPENAVGGPVAADPITCWSKTDKSAVIVGERFTLTITCAFVETSGLTVVPKLDELDSGAIPITPFEALSHTRHQDIQAPPRRYVQYEYSMRLLAPGFFGQDVNVPPITVTYNIQSTANAAAQGRDLMYVLPAIPMRIASLVPKAASDIRDAPNETFADIEARLFRSTTELVAAAISFAFSLAVLGLAVVRVVRRHRARTPAVARTLPAGAMLRGCLREISRLRSEVAREGWSSERVAAALSVFRVAGAVALELPVTQAQVAVNVPKRAGQFTVPKGILRSTRTSLSAPITADAIDRYRAMDHAGLSNGRSQQMLEPIRESLRVFSTARYGRNGNLNAELLDQALEDGGNALRRLRVAALWPVRTVGALAKSAAALGSMVWSR